MTTNEAIEHVARALLETPDDPEGLGGVMRQARAAYRASLEAIRELPAQVHGAGTRALRQRPDLPEQHQVQVCWEVIIDQLIKELDHDDS